MAFTSKEEILAQARRIVEERQNARNGPAGSKSVNVASEESERTDSDTDVKSGFDVDGAAEQTRHATAGNGTVNNTLRGFNGRDSTISESTGPGGSIGSGAYEHIGGTPADTRVPGGSSEQIAPNGHQRFYQPYANAIRDSVQQRSKEASARKKSSPKQKVLTDSEVRIKRAALIEALLWQSEHLDSLIIATTKGHNHALVIWGDLDVNDAEVIADFLLARARVDSRAAAAVNGIIQVRNNLRLGLILAPRAYRTVMYYLQTGFSIY